MNYDVIIIGSGMIGSMSARLLANKGISVLIIDSNEKMSGSKCSFGIFKEGWIDEKLKTPSNETFRVIENFTSIDEVEYYNYDKNCYETFKRINPEFILSKIPDVEYLKAKVYTWDKNGEEFEVLTIQSPTRYKCKILIVAAGVWTDDIINKNGSYGQNNIMGSPIIKQWGAVIRYQQSIDVSRYKTWAPYKQSILFKRSDNEFLFGDGSMIKNPIESVRTKQNEVINRMKKHCNDLTKVDVPDTEVMEGYRPFFSSELRNWIEEPVQNLFAATGGRKSTTILCGYIANTILNKITNGY